MKFFLKNKKGFSVIEIMIACAIISTSIFALVSSASKGVQLSNQVLKQTQASILLEEGAEAVKSIRDNLWTDISSLTVGTTYYLSFNTTTNKWSLSTTASTIDFIFTRTIVITAVNRDSNDDITTSGGTLDLRTKKVSINVSWNNSSNTTTSKDLSFYMSDIFN